MACTPAPSPVIDAAEVSAKELAELQNEVDTLKAMNHPNIVRYIGTERSEDTLSIFLEYVRGGSIRGLLERFGRLDESIIRVYTRQLLLGLEYLHRNGIAHRDIKGANVLVDSDGTIKLADFGASKRLSSKTASLNKTGTGIKGTPLWMAPEVIRSPQDARGWRKADVWSLGCTVYEMATGKPPFSEFDNPVTAMYHIACMETDPPIPESLSPIGQDFLRQCLQRDPQARANISTLLLHPFVASFGLLRGQAGGPAAAQLPMRPTTAGVPNLTSRVQSERRRSPGEKRLPIIKKPIELPKQRVFNEGSDEDSSPAVHAASFEIGESSEDSIPSSIERTPRADAPTDLMNRYGVLDTIRVAPADMPGLQLSLGQKDQKAVGSSNARLLPPLSARSKTEKDDDLGDTVIGRRLRNVGNLGAYTQSHCHDSSISPLLVSLLRILSLPMAPFSSCCHADIEQKPSPPTSSRGTTPSPSPSPSPPGRLTNGNTAYPPRQQRSTPFKPKPTAEIPPMDLQLGGFGGIQPISMPSPVYSRRGSDRQEEDPSPFEDLRSPIGADIPLGVKDPQAVRAPSRIPRPRTRVTARADEGVDQTSPTNLSMSSEKTANSSDRARPNHSPVTTNRRRDAKGKSKKKTSTGESNGERKRSRKKNRKKSKEGVSAKKKSDEQQEAKENADSATRPVQKRVTMVAAESDAAASTRSPSAEPVLLSSNKPAAGSGSSSSTTNKSKASRIQSAGRYRFMNKKQAGPNGNAEPMNRRRTASATPTRGLGRVATSRSRSPIAGEARGMERALGIGIRLHPPPGVSEEDEEEDGNGNNGGADVIAHGPNETEIVIDEEQSRWDSSIDSAPDAPPSMDVSPLKHESGTSRLTIEHEDQGEVPPGNVPPSIMSPSSVLSSASSIAYSPPSKQLHWQEGVQGSRVRRDALLISSLSHAEDSALPATPVVMPFKPEAPVTEEDESMYFESPAGSVPMMLDMSVANSMDSEPSMEEAQEMDNGGTKVAPEDVMESLEDSMLQRIASLDSQVISCIAVSVTPGAQTVLYGGICSGSVIKLQLLEKEEELGSYTAAAQVTVNPSVTTKKHKAPLPSPEPSPQSSRGGHRPDLTMAVSGHRAVAGTSPDKSAKGKSNRLREGDDDEEGSKRRSYNATVVAATEADEDGGIALYCGTAQGTVLSWVVEAQGRSLTVHGGKSLRGHRGGIRTLHVWHEPATANGETTAAAAAAAASERRLITGSMDATLRVWRIGSGSGGGGGGGGGSSGSSSCLFVLKGHRGAITTSCILPNGLLASGSVDQSVRIWDVKTGRAVHVLRDLYSGVTTIASVAMASPFAQSFHAMYPLSPAREGEAKEDDEPVTPLLVAASKDGSMRQWDSRGTAQGLDKGSKHVVSISSPHGDAPGGATIGAGEAGGILRIWDTQRIE
ncbi:NPK1 [Symbiodinium sp. KB8]|nr:NPK1 [Symbiodinium sp. KB8]